MKLYLASRQGKARAVAALLAKQGVDVNQADEDGATPLYVASRGGHAEVVSMLLAKEGVNVNKAWNGHGDGQGITPLRAAIDGGHTEIAKQLVLRGSILVDAPTGAYRNQINLMLGQFAHTFKSDFAALCVFRLCLVRAYHDQLPIVEGAPSPAQRWRIAARRMSRKGAFAWPRIESFLVPCHADPFKKDLIVRQTLTTIIILANSNQEVEAASRPSSSWCVIS